MKNRINNFIEKKVTKLVFVTDHRFIKRNDKIFSIAFNDNTLARYKIYAENFVVLANQESNDNNIKSVAEIRESVDHFFLLSPKTNLKEFLLDDKRSKQMQNAIQNSDFIIARLPSLNGISAIKLAKKFKIPYIVEVVGDIDEVGKVRNSFLGRLYAQVQKKQIINVVKNASHSIYVTRQFLQAKYQTNGKQVGISNVCINFTEDTVLTNRIQRDQEKETNKVKIGFIGSPLSPRKGLGILINAASILEKKGLSIEIEVIGKADKEKVVNYLSTFSNNHIVNFIGSLSPGNQIFSWLDTLDLYAQPSTSEGLPRALIEAMSRGLPCLGSSAGGIPELLNKPQLHDIGNFHQLAESIEKIIKDDNLRIELAKENFEKAKKYSEKYLSSLRNEFIGDFLKCNNII